ncbi:MAG: hypothetical protein PHI53_01920 [Candidatus Pacebacteria bacterium]|nr:hypothetical protein [Candidatus Paceibacterota bacterium]
MTVKKIKRILLIYSDFLVYHIFWACLFSFLLSLIIGAVIFYASTLSYKDKNDYVLNLKIEEKSYQEILRFWHEQEERLKDIDLKEYKSPFSD